MRVLFLIHDVITIPLGITYIASILQKRGHEPGALTIRDPELDRRVKDWNPDVIAFGCTTGFHRQYFSVARRLKDQHPDIPIIAGGAHATFFPEDFDRNPFIDYMIMGEADTAVTQMVEAIEGSRPFPDVGNLIRRDSGRTVRNAMLPLVEDLDTIPFPKRDILVGYRPSTADRAAFCITGRGCPYSCTYCFNHSLKKLYSGLGTYVRRRSVDNVIGELVELRDASPALQMIVFQDDTFVLGHDWVREFCERYPSEVGLPFHCHVRANHLTPGIAKVIAKAGCLSVKMAVETTDDRARNDILGRNMDMETIRGACRSLKDAGIRFVTQNILCIPTCSFEDDVRTMSFNSEMRPDFTFATLLQPYPGTEIARFCKENGFIDSAAEAPETPDSFFHASVLDIPDRKRRERLRALFALSVEFPILMKLAGFLTRLPLGGLYSFMDKIWKGYCIKQRIFPYRLTAAEYARDVISYFRSNYY
ncbi:MAG: radical SAM protein [Candidatus Fermentibacter sp.]|nr:radical SAM protein [Candidatus Fermentibacter sp.]